MSDCNGTCEVCVCKTGTNLKTIHYLLITHEPLLWRTGKTNYS
jgi:hypothetical protein